MQLGNHATYPRLQLTEVNWVYFRPDQYVTSKIITKLTGHVLGWKKRSGHLHYKDWQNHRQHNSRPERRDVRVLASATTGPRPDLGATLYGYRDHGQGQPQFSAGGDSGSMCIVPDEDGRPLMLGLVMGGRGHTARTHKIFTYPWFHFVENIMPNLIKEKILPK
jgi:hypothetical protein